MRQYPTSVPMDLPARLLRWCKSIDPADLLDGGEPVPSLDILDGLADSLDAQTVADALASLPPPVVTLGQVRTYRFPGYDELAIPVHGRDLDAFLHVLAEQGVSGAGEADPRITLARLRPGAGQDYSGDDTFDGEHLALGEPSLHAADGTVVKAWQQRGPDKSDPTGKRKVWYDDQTHETRRQVVMPGTTAQRAPDDGQRHPEAVPVPKVARRVEGKGQEGEKPPAAVPANPGKFQARQDLTPEALSALKLVAQDLRATQGLTNDQKVSIASKAQDMLARMTPDELRQIHDNHASRKPGKSLRKAMAALHPDLARALPEPAKKPGKLAGYAKQVAGEIGDAGGRDLVNDVVRAWKYLEEKGVAAQVGNFLVSALKGIFGEMPGPEGASPARPAPARPAPASKTVKPAEKPDTGGVEWPAAPPTRQDARQGSGQDARQEEKYPEAIPVERQPVRPQRPPRPARQRSRDYDDLSREDRSEVERVLNWIENRQARDRKEGTSGKKGTLRAENVEDLVNDLVWDGWDISRGGDGKWSVHNQPDPDRPARKRQPEEKHPRLKEFASMKPRELSELLSDAQSDVRKGRATQGELDALVADLEEEGWQIRHEEGIDRYEAVKRTVPDDEDGKRSRQEYGKEDMESPEPRPIPSTKAFRRELFRLVDRLVKKWVNKPGPRSKNRYEWDSDPNRVRYFQQPPPGAVNAAGEPMTPAQKQAATVGEGEGDQKPQARPARSRTPRTDPQEVQGKVQAMLQGKEVVDVPAVADLLMGLTVKQAQEMTAALGIDLAGARSGAKGTIVTKLAVKLAALAVQGKLGGDPGQKTKDADPHSEESLHRLLVEGDIQRMRSLPEEVRRRPGKGQEIQKEIDRFGQANKEFYGEEGPPRSRSGDVARAGDASEPERKEEKPEPAPAPSASGESRVSRDDVFRAAIKALHLDGGDIHDEWKSGSSISLREMRQMLPGVSKEDFDRAVLDAAERGELAIHAQTRHGSLTDVDKANLVEDENGVFYNFASFRSDNDATLSHARKLAGDMGDDLKEHGSNGQDNRAAIEAEMERERQENARRWSEKMARERAREERQRDKEQTAADPAEKPAGGTASPEESRQQAAEQQKPTSKPQSRDRRPGAWRERLRARQEALSRVPEDRRHSLDVSEEEEDKPARRRPESRSERVERLRRKVEQTGRALDE